MLPSSTLQALLTHPRYVEALERVRQRWGDRAPLELLTSALADTDDGEPISMTFHEAGPFAWVTVNRAHTGMNWFHYVRAERGFLCDEAHITLPLALREARVAVQDAPEAVLETYEALAYSVVARSRRDVASFRGHALREDGSSALDPATSKRVRVPRFAGDHYVFCASYPWGGLLREVRVHSRTFEVSVTDLGPGLFVEAPMGRAYHDAGTPVRAPLREGPCDAIPLVAPVGQREALALAWREIGLSEHASLGSFARAQAELLAMGAPLSLLARMHHAALDEVRHATLAFGVAAGLDGRSLIAGPLPALAPREPSWRRVIEDTLHEAAIPETLAAAELRASAEAAHDSALCQLLHRIAEDEERHAALAWDTLAWALTQAGDEGKALLRDVRCPPEAACRELPAGFGFLGADAQAALRERVWREEIIGRLQQLQ